MIERHRNAPGGRQLATKSRRLLGEGAATFVCQEKSMTRLNMIVIAMGGFAAATVLPLAARAQSGDALAHAETLCLESGIGPNSIAFEACVGRAARAYDLGEPDLAAVEAHKVNDAHQACLADDIEPMTAGYRQCMDNETGTLTVSRYAVSSYEPR
jgi:hypothetical protein